MRYTEPKERSAELLRAAIAKMSQHDAAFNPVTFAVWYEVLAGSNLRLEQALNARLQVEPRLGDATLLKLFHEYISDTDDETMSRLSLDFQHMMDAVSQTATRTDHSAGRFGRQLDGLSNALRSEDRGSVEPALNDILSGIAEMKRSTEALQHQVSASQREIDRLRTDLTRAREEALTDSLTGVLNRNGFDRRLDQLLKQASGTPVLHCLVMFDIDHFKIVNDTHGHVVGDRVLAAIGKVLQDNLGGTANVAARYGGEEFAVLLPYSSIDDAARLAETVRVRTKAMKLRKRDTQEVLLTVTVSAGVAATQPGDDASGLIARADAALYRSKQQGRDRVTLG